MKKKRAASPVKVEPNIPKATEELIVPKATDNAPPKAELNNPKASEFAQAELIVPKAAEDAPPEASDFDQNLVQIRSHCDIYFIVPRSLMN